MGKAKAYKEFKKFAFEMPQIFVKGSVCERMTGKEVIEKGIAQKDDSTIAKNRLYKVKRAVKVPVNHYEKMKELYKKGGMIQVERYRQAVKEWQEKENQIQQSK